MTKVDDRTTSDLIAFYGTLRSDVPANSRAPDLEPHVELVSTCAVRGVLYDAGKYPGLIKGDGMVRGELHRLISTTALDVLDAWENYFRTDIENSQFRRERMQLLTPSVYAWIYVWNRPIDGLVRIADGDWRSYIEGRDGR